ncbi:MAG TPA: hypothetical protein PK014_11505 [Thermoanaerobaculia bacterium]|nr:hypothetical protein [Thermoanaerobaculia bacterium]HUM30717.1 hypothetical protein [Thermoanaerobaculia bacterium]HXK68994.1 hypothetical protein [Thermoanaerobaculia bacterium]
MNVHIRPGTKVLSLDPVGTVGEMLNVLGMRREEVLVIDREEGILLQEGDKLSPDQSIEVRRVISGG